MYIINDVHQSYKCEPVYIVFESQPHGKGLKCHVSA